MLHGVDEMQPSVDENYSQLDEMWLCVYEMLPGVGEIELCVPCTDEMQVDEIQPCMDEMLTTWINRSPGVDEM